MGNRTDPALVRDWLKALGSAVVGGLSRDEASAKLGIMTPWAAQDFGPECFTARTLKWAAEEFKFFPAYAELAEFLRKQRRDEPPRLSYDIPQPRTPPTPGEIDHVGRLVAAFTAERAAAGVALGTLPPDQRPKPLHLSPGQLLAAYEAQRKAGATGLEQRIEVLRRQIGLAEEAEDRDVQQASELVA